MLAWHLGLRYLRKRRAAWLALAAITLTVAVPVGVVGVMHGFVEVTRKQVRANEADLTLEAGFRGDRIVDRPQNRAALLGIPGVAAIAPFVATHAIMTPKQGGSERDNLPCLVDGLDWAADSALGRIAGPQLHPAPVLDLHAQPIPPEQRGSGFLTPAWRDHLALSGLDLLAGLGLGPLPLPPRQRPLPGVVVGRELAYINWLRPGDDVQLIVPNGMSGATGQISATVSDTIGTGVYETDRYVCLVPLPQAQRLAGLAAREGKPARLTGYRLQAAQDQDLGALAAAVQAETGKRVATWMERRGSMVKNMEVQRNIIGLVMIAIQIIAVFIVYAVFSTLVAEKRHDIGVLIGIGAPPRSIAGAFLLAGLAACLAGGLLGWAIGWGALAALNPFSRLTGLVLFPQDVMYTPEAPISWNPLIPLLFLGIMSLVGLLAVALPAWRAARIDPVAILREGG